jgi:hypothetical protein
VTACRAVSRAWLMVSAQDSADVVQWRSPAAAPPDACRNAAVSGSLIAADDMAGEARSLEIADVIYREERPCGARPPAWLARTLHRYPGCTVAVIPEEGGRYLIAPRSGRPVSLSFFAPNEPGCDALVSAVFTYGWLCAGWPLAALVPPRLEAAGRLRLAARAVTVPVSFSMSYEYVPPAPESLAGPRSPSRRRISPASGASTPE